MKLVYSSDHQRRPLEGAPRVPRSGISEKIRPVTRRGAVTRAIQKIPEGNEHGLAFDLEILGFSSLVAGWCSAVRAQRSGSKNRRTPEAREVQLSRIYLRAHLPPGRASLRGVHCHYSCYHWPSDCMFGGKRSWDL